MSKKLKPIVVTVTDAALADIRQLADRLTAKGMKVDRVLPVTGVITGACDPAGMPALQKLAGVMSVGEEVVAELAPPGSAVQ